VEKQLISIQANTPTDPSDANLVRQARTTHGRAAFATLYRHYLTPVYRYFYARTGDAQQAKDLTAQTFVAALGGSRAGTGRAAQQARAQDLAEETPEMPEALKSLTCRERKGLALLAEGKTDPEIAEALRISTHTASTHVRNLLGKLKVKNRVQAAVLWDRYSQGRQRR
jgi:two-component system NarL family response regulator